MKNTMIKGSVLCMFVLALLFTSLTGCGGGGGGGDDPTPPGTQDSAWDSMTWDQGTWE